MKPVIQSSIKHAVHAILAAFLLSTAGVTLAIDVEETVLVPPGVCSVSVDLAPSTSLVSVYGPFHGQLIETAEGLTYEPNKNFWPARSDFAIVHLTFSDRTTNVPTVLRLRFIVGETAWDGEVAIVGDLTGLPPSWKEWTIDNPGGALGIEGGLLVDQAYVFGTEDVDGPSITVDIEDDTGAGNGTTTSTTNLDVEVRDLPNRQHGGSVGMTFFEIKSGGDLIGGLDALWVEDPFASGWYVRPTSSLNTMVSSSVPLQIGRNRLKVLRWSNLVKNEGAIELFVNDVWVARLPVDPLDRTQPETHQIMLTNIPGPGTQELVVEDPIARISSNVIDPTARLNYDNFTGGADAAWTVVNPAPQSLSAQDLPGPGDRLDVDLGLLSSSQSSYLEREVPLPFGGVPDPPGFGMRVWIDPTAVSLPVGSSVRVATACSETGSCGPARIWLGRDASGLTITATAWRNGGTAARIETPISNMPHSVEVRLRNGWLPGLINGALELWIDGILIGRETGIDNHSGQIKKLRLGILSDTDGSTGVIGLDDYEAWRID